jgi:hypothetical protein
MEQKPCQITDEKYLSYKIAKYVLTAGSYCCGDCREISATL